jgi:hypothetical protein
MCRVLNKHKDVISKDDVYIGRGSKFGNPFVIGKDGSRDEVIEKYENYLNEHPELITLAMKELKNKNLVCFCAPQRCHGDILLEIANDLNIFGE